jgi:hypothetical protein
MKNISKVNAFAATIIAIMSLGVETNAALITFGEMYVDPLATAGPITEGEFTYQAFGSAWDITTALGNPGASLATAWNGAIPVVGQTVEVRATSSSPFFFHSVDFRTVLSSSSDALVLTGYLTGETVGTLILDYSATTFATIASPFNDPIDLLVIRVADHGNNSALVDNLSLSVVPEPSSALLLGLGVAGFWALRRKLFRN